jgi:glycosyltransferase involved in cell wall biosynthesis
MLKQKSNNKKILIICPHPLNVAPGQRLKYEQYFDYFKQNGFDVTVKPFMTIKFWKIVYKKGYFFQKVLWTLYGYFNRFILLFKIRKYNLTYVFLWVTPFGLPLFEWLTVKLAKKIVYDIDDMVFLGHSSEANRFIQNLKGRNKMIFLMKHSHHVITCTPALDNFVRQFNSNTTDISSTINTKTYKPKTNYKLNNPITLGWSGSHSTSKYLLLLEPVFEELLKTNIDFHVLCIGNENFSFKNTNIPLKAIPWKLETEVEDLSKIDIGLYPLPDEPWVYGKSGLKALQYMALGIPTLATAVGTNFRIIDDGKNGFLIPVNNTQIWLNRIIDLVNSESLRQKIGMAGRKTVEEKYSVEANKDKYLHVLNSLCID